MSPSNSCLNRLNADYSQTVFIYLTVVFVHFIIIAPLPHELAHNKELHFLFGLVCNNSDAVKADFLITSARARRFVYETHA